jgi:uncharacterized phosphosugar-binding protein
MKYFVAGCKYNMLCCNSKPSNTLIAELLSQTDDELCLVRNAEQNAVPGEDSEMFNEIESFVTFVTSMEVIVGYNCFTEYCTDRIELDAK